MDLWFTYRTSASSFNWRKFVPDISHFISSRDCLFIYCCQPVAQLLSDWCVKATRNKATCTVFTKVNCWHQSQLSPNAGEFPGPCSFLAAVKSNCSVCTMRTFFLNNHENSEQNLDWSWSIWKQISVEIGCEWSEWSVLGWMLSAFPSLQSLDERGWINFRLIFEIWTSRIIIWSSGQRRKCYNLHSNENVNDNQVGRPQSNILGRSTKSKPGHLAMHKCVILSLRSPLTIKRTTPHSKMTD